MRINHAGLQAAVFAGGIIANAASPAPTPSASAESLTPGTVGINWQPSDDTQSTCDQSTFAEAPNADAANWRECAALYSSWSTANGTFIVSKEAGDEFAPVLKVQDCTLAVQVSDPSRVPYVIGDKDIKTLLQTSLKQFSEGTELSVVGNLNCAAAGGTKSAVNWRISKS